MEAIYTERERIRKQEFENIWVIISMTSFLMLLLIIIERMLCQPRMWNCGVNVLFLLLISGLARRS